MTENNDQIEVIDTPAQTDQPDQLKENAKVIASAAGESTKIIAEKTIEGSKKLAVILSDFFKNLIAKIKESRAEAKVKAEEEQVRANSANLSSSPSDIKLESTFDGGLFELIGRNILGSLITTITLGICYPLAVCFVYSWEIDHTIIEGRRLKFTGKAIGLWGNWIKWTLLSLITLGIYAFWVPIKIRKWKASHTIFAN